MVYVSRLLKYNQDTCLRVIIKKGIIKVKLRGILRVLLFLGSGSRWVVLVVVVVGGSGEWFKARRNK